MPPAQRDRCRRTAVSAAAAIPSSLSAVVGRPPLLFVRHSPLALPKDKNRMRIFILEDLKTWIGRGFDALQL